MRSTRYTHQIPRWAWVAVVALLSVLVVATTAVTTSHHGGEPEGDDPVANPEIVGGRSAQPGEFPYAVALVRRSSPDPFAGLFCGGSLIGPDLVLTAAHCVDGASAVEVDALVGTNDLRVGGRRIGAERLHPHPDHDPATSANDVAVIELATFADGVPLVSVLAPGRDEIWAPGTAATVVGWGSTKVAGYPTSLHAVDVPIVSDQSCRSSYGRLLVEAVMVCAGEEGGGRDSCRGDSGGPLLVDDGARMTQVGVVSWGFGCALPGLPGVYAEAVALRGFLDPFLDGFRDLPEWAAEAITWLTDNDFADGFPDRRFRPDQTLTRAQAVQILYRVVSPPAEADGRAPHPFADVPAWIEDAVRWAGLDPDGDGPAGPPMSGYPDGTFRPDRPVSRGEFSRLLWRLAGTPVAAGHGFTDVGPWVEPAVSWMADEGLATGWPDGAFRPDDGLTRAQAARILQRAFGGG